MTVNFQITKITGGVCNQYPFTKPVVPPGSTYQLVGSLGTLSPGNFGYLNAFDDYLSHISGSFSGIPVNFRENGKLYQDGYGGGPYPNGTGIGTWERNEAGILVTLNGSCPNFVWGCNNPGTYQFTWVTGGTNVIPVTVPCGNLG